MKRAYHKWYSPNLNRNMELLVFGHAGAKVLFFPPRMGRFYDYENWGVVASLKEKIEKGFIQLYCVDSLDIETFYSKTTAPKNRIIRHLAYEQYILKEVLPLTNGLNSNPYTIAAGCSLGAYHALNIAMKYPKLFCKVVAMSGRYDLTIPVKYYKDLLSGYHDENVYYNMPNQYLKNLNDLTILEAIKKLDIILVVGKTDPLLGSNYKLSSLYKEKGITCKLYQWDGEAHKARYWRKMVQIYL